MDKTDIKYNNIVMEDWKAGDAVVSGFLSGLVVGSGIAFSLVAAGLL